MRSCPRASLISLEAPPADQWRYRLPEAYWSPCRRRTWTIRVGRVPRLAESTRSRDVVAGLSLVIMLLGSQASVRDLRELASLQPVAAQAAAWRTSAEPAPAPPAATASPLTRYTATAYCKGTTTASGARVRSGIVAADPDLLPVGSVIKVVSQPERYSGVYTVLDTGPKVKGRIIDIYMWSCHEALAFGRRPVRVQVVRHGWSPDSASAPDAMAHRPLPGPGTLPVHDLVP